MREQVFARTMKLSDLNAPFDLTSHDTSRTTTPHATIHHPPAKRRPSPIPPRTSLQTMTDTRSQLAEIESLLAATPDDPSLLALKDDLMQLIALEAEQSHEGMAPEQPHFSKSDGEIPYCLCYWLSPSLPVLLSTFVSSFDFALTNLCVIKSKGLVHTIFNR